MTRDMYRPAAIITTGILCLTLVVADLVDRWRGRGY